MHTLDLISQRTAVLPENLQQEVLDFVEFLVVKSHPLIPQAGSTSQRIPGLQRGKVQIAEDFDEPLPDDFWLGKA
jgi:hypothetical protein